MLKAIKLGLTLLILLDVPLFGSSADLFRDQYAAKEAKLEQAYAHVKITTEIDGTDATGRFESGGQDEYLRNGQMLRRISTVLKSNSPKPEIGEVTAMGGMPEKFFILSKPSGSAKFQILSFGKQEPFGKYISFLPVFCPYCASGFRVIDYINGKDARFSPANTTILDGRTVIELDSQFPVPKQADIFVRFYFLPDSYALAGWDLIGPALPSTPLKIRYWVKCRMIYAPGSDPPRLQMVDYWTYEPKKPGVKIDERRDTVTDIEFVKIPASQFTLAALGVNEPAMPGRSSSQIRWTLMLTGIGLAILGIIFAFLAHGRKRKRNKLTESVVG